MKLRLFACLALGMLASTASAQNPFDDEPRVVVRQPVTVTAPLPALSPESMTPEMYLYLQDQRRHDDPAQAVRRKAEMRAAQRMDRIAAMKWFGMSNARPQAATVPMMGVYSPAWIGNGYDRYDWVGGNGSTATVVIDADGVRR
jgi:hypothetical protein